MSECKKEMKLCDHLFLSAIFLLAFIFFNVLISTVLFIFKVDITSANTIIATFLTIVLNIIFLKRKNLSKKDKLISIITTIIFPIVVIILSVFINGKVLDTTWDGNSYQKGTSGLLADGWNPLYEDVEVFDRNKDISIVIRDENPVVINHYAKGSNVFGANIYKLTGNIETAKSINTISIIMMFLFTLSLLLHKRKSVIFSLLFSICAITYPVICAQFLTNYLDLLVYIFLYLTIYCFFLFEEKGFIFTPKESSIAYFMILSIAINLKFSLFAYVGIFCLGYYVWYVYRLQKNKVDKNFFWHFTWVSIIAVLIGVFVIGLSVYPKNFVDHGNLFYPLFGNDKIDIMTSNEPKEFNRKSPIEKFVISTFSKCADIYETSEEKTKFKIPFTFNNEEFFATSLPDTRISGNGILFSRNINS